MSTAVKRSSDALNDSAPPGFHWVGDKPTLLPNGKVSLPIRRDSSKSRKEKYRDLFLEVRKEDKVYYLCCVYGCDRNTVENGVSMFLDKSTVQFQNFLSHLCSCHPDVLEKSDRPVTKEKASESMMDFLVSDNTDGQPAVKAGGSYTKKKVRIF
jgi:hypothetical protein